MMTSVLFGLKAGRRRGRRRRRRRRERHPSPPDRARVAAE
jgi:hypothetical protein